MERQTERVIWLSMFLLAFLLVNLRLLDRPFDLKPDTLSIGVSLAHNATSRVYATRPRTEISPTGNYSIIKFKLNPSLNKMGLRALASGDGFNLERPIKLLKERKSNSTNCHDLVSGDDAIYEREVQYANVARKQELLRNFNDKSLAIIAKNCSNLRLLFERNITTDQKTEDNAIAYSILVDRSAEQTLTLLRSIYSPSNIYCLHVDKKSDIERKNFVVRLARCYPNVVLPKRRYKITAQTVTRLYAELSCFKALLNVSHKPWKFLINLPGTAFPLRNNTNIVDYLRTREYVNEISSRLPKSIRFRRRTGYVHVLRNYHGTTYFVRTRRRKPPPPGDITLFRGEEAFIATRAFCQFVLTDQLSKELLLWSHDAKNPEEYYWASLHRHPHAPGGVPYRNEEENFLTETSAASLDDETEDITDVPDTDLLATLWKSDGSHRCAGEYRNNLCTFGGGDLKWLVKQDKLFAASFDMAVDRTVIDCLEINLKKPLVEDYYFQLRNEIEYV